MTISQFLAQCRVCQKQFNIEQILERLVCVFPLNSDQCELLLICDNCRQSFTAAPFSRADYLAYDELIEQYQPPPFESMTDEQLIAADQLIARGYPFFGTFYPEPGEAPANYDYDQKHIPVGEKFISETAEQILVPKPPPQPENTKQSSQQNDSRSPKDYYSLFLGAINAIDKNLPKNEQFNKISGALNVLCGATAPEKRVCMSQLKTKFHLTARDIEAFTKVLNQKEKEYLKEQQQAQNKKIIDQCTRKPKILSSEEKMRATAYLQDLDLINNISRDIGYAGNLIGEETNKMMLYFASISRKFETPISLVIFGKSSSGKSYLVNAIEKFIPPEDSLTLSSASARGLEYLGDQLQHKCILIQEWDGAENILPTIRTLQSEGKLNRLVTIEDPDSPNKRRSVAMSFDCPCSVVITTTLENLHDENSTRIFELYADESVAQTENIIESSIASANINNSIDKKDKKNIIELHRDVQRCLDKLEVSIPFTGYLTFPKKTTRHRRDVERFLQLIKVVTFLRQKQKNILEKNGTRFIEADLYDYEIAYHYGISILKNTLNKISQRAKEALIVCCSIADEKGKGVNFTTKDIQEKALKHGYDFNNRQDLYKQLKILTEYEYLEYEQPKAKGTKYYQVCFDYVKDQNGNIINIDSPDIKDITTPEQLKRKLATA